jgi:hypothetical protein
MNRKRRLQKVINSQILKGYQAKAQLTMIKTPRMMAPKKLMRGRST